MACNIPIEDTNVEDGRSENETGGVRKEAEEKVKHCFSEPWKDSDVILVVEDEKFHVHRLILSMNSPVFEAMFKSQFKESTANEIPLPEKKASEVLDFLKKVYGSRYTQERVKITIENVGHLLKLSDEYQVKAIFNSCVKFLDNQQKTKANVMKIRTLAELYNLDKVRHDCDDLLKDMTLKSMSEIVNLQDLDRDKLQHLLTQRIERLETFLDKLYPQFTGLVDLCIWLLYKANKGAINWCPEHFEDGRVNSDIDKRIGECTVCKKMLLTLTKFTEAQKDLDYRISGKPYMCGGSQRFNNRFPDVVQEFIKFMKQ